MTHAKGCLAEYPLGCYGIDCSCHCHRPDVAHLPSRCGATFDHDWHTTRDVDDRRVVCDGQTRVIQPDACRVCEHSVAACERARVKCCPECDHRPNPPGEGRDS